MNQDADADVDVSFGEDGGLHVAILRGVGQGRPRNDLIYHVYEALLRYMSTATKGAFWSGSDLVIVYQNTARGAIMSFLRETLAAFSLRPRMVAG